MIITMAILKPTTQSILRTIVDRQTDGELPIKVIEAETGLNNYTIRLHIKRLQSLGFISASRQHSNRPFRFVIHPKTYMELKLDRDSNGQISELSAVS